MEGRRVLFPHWRTSTEYAAPQGWLTKPGMGNYEGSHADQSRDQIEGGGSRPIIWRRASGG